MYGRRYPYERSIIIICTSRQHGRVILNIKRLDFVERKNNKQKIYHDMFCLPEFVNKFNSLIGAFSQKEQKSLMKLKISRELC